MYLIRFFHIGNLFSSSSSCVECMLCVYVYVCMYVCMYVYVEAFCCVCIIKHKIRNVKKRNKNKNKKKKKGRIERWNKE